jgi:hypothetical protein
VAGRQLHICGVAAPFVPTCHTQQVCGEAASYGGK